jgi:hypothetical protein
MPRLQTFVTHVRGPLRSALLCWLLGILVVWGGGVAAVALLFIGLYLLFNNAHAGGIALAWALGVGVGSYYIGRALLRLGTAQLTSGALVAGSAVVGEVIDGEVVPPKSARARLPGGKS